MRCFSAAYQNFFFTIKPTKIDQIDLSFDIVHLTFAKMKRWAKFTDS